MHKSHYVSKEDDINVELFTFSTILNCQTPTINGVLLRFHNICLLQQVCFIPWEYYVKPVTM